MADAGIYESSMNQPTIPPELVAGALPPEDTSRWPKVIGIISLIYALFGMLCGISYAGSTIFTSQLLAMGGMKDVDLPMPIKLTVVALVVFDVALGVVLLMGAINLLRRKRSGVRLHLRWALWRMILILVAAATTIFTAKASVEFEKARLEAMNRTIEERGGEPREIPSVADLHRKTFINVAIFSAVQSIYPLFIGFYLSRRKIREQIAHWPNN